MKSLILLSLSCLLLTSCGTPKADKPDLGIAPKPCPPSLQADVPVAPDVPVGAGIIKPPVGSHAATATGVYLDYVDRLNDTVNELIRRANQTKVFCEGRG